MDDNKIDEDLKKEKKINLISTNNSTNNSNNKIYREVAPYLNLGLQLAVTICVCIFLGIWLDKKFDLSPLFTLFFTFLGFAAGFYNFFKTINNNNKTK